MDEDVTSYIKKQKPLQRSLCKELRKIFLKNFPDLQEEMHLGVPYYNKQFYMVALKDHVNFGFSVKNFSQKEIAKFKGSGKTVKVLELHSLDEINKKLIVDIIKQVL